MTDRHAFLRVIKDNPADDTPRLVYADWLEEHGEPEWAELVRVQIELERVGRKTHSHAFCQTTNHRCLECREAKLRQRAIHSIGFEPGHIFGIVEGQDEVFLLRGVLEVLRCSWAFWREHGDLIWERELPWKVRLTTQPHIGDDEDIQYVGRTRKSQRYRIAGRITAVPRNLSIPDTFLDWLPHILSARWPGIEFEFAFDFDTHRMIDGTTREQLA